MTAKDISTNTIETHRKFWAQVARQHNWYTEPFFVHVWVDKNNEIVDSVSHKGLSRDIIDQN